MGATDDIPTGVLQRGERVLWSSVTPYRDPEQLAPDESWPLFAKAAKLFAAALALFLLAVLPEVWPVVETLLIAAAVAMFAWGVVTLLKSPFFTRAAHFSLVMYAPSYVSCVITDQRVLLFNNPAKGVVSLQRSDLASPMLETGEGTSAVMFSSPHFSERYLFITEDFVAPIRLLSQATPSLHGATP